MLSDTPSNISEIIFFKAKPKTKPRAPAAVIIPVIDFAKTKLNMPNVAVKKILN